MKQVKIITPILILGFLGLTSCSDRNLIRSQAIAESIAGVNFCTTPAQSIVTKLNIFSYSIIPEVTNKTILSLLLELQLVQMAVLQHQMVAYLSALIKPVELILMEQNGFLLVQFLQGINDDANTFYASINFADTTTPYFNWTDSNGNRTTAAQAVTKFQNQPDGWLTPMNGAPVADNLAPIDGGNTDYLDTLDAISAMITQDVQTESAAAVQGQPIVSSDYVIVWISDGAPYVNGNLQNAATIYGKVQAIMALRSASPDYIDSITLSTGFYATADEYLSSEYNTAMTIMSTMATYGQGSFVNFATNVIDYTKFTVPAKQAKFEVRDFWIQNASTVWWNGQLMLDSDHDGIPDAIEATMGSNPNAGAGYDSDGNGVGDGVEYALYGSPCKDANCNPANARSFQAQCGAMPAGGYPDSDGDYLNNCEEILLGSKFDDFDSNQDWVPDEFEWVNKVAFVSGTNSLLSDPLNDGLSDYFKLKQNLPVSTPLNSMSGYQVLKYQMTQVSDNPSQTCYNVNVQDLATIGNQNLIRMYVMESRGAAGNVRHMRVAQKVTNGSLVFSDSDFTP